jgi:hypothetical protein
MAYRLSKAPHQFPGDPASVDTAIIPGRAGTLNPSSTNISGA